MAKIYYFGSKLVQYRQSDKDDIVFGSPPENRELIKAIKFLGKSIFL